MYLSPPSKGIYCSGPTPLVAAMRCLVANLIGEEIDLTTAVSDIKTFETFAQVSGLAPCMKKPIIVHAKKMDGEFRVDSLEGNYKQGIERREVYAHSEDWPAIKALADRLTKRRAKAVPRRAP